MFADIILLKNEPITSVLINGYVVKLILSLCVCNCILVISSVSKESSFATNSDLFKWLHTSNLTVYKTEKIKEDEKFGRERKWECILKHFGRSEGLTS